MLGKWEFACFIRPVITVDEGIAWFRTCVRFRCPIGAELMGFNFNKDVVVGYRGVFERVPLFTTVRDISDLLDNGIM